MCCFRDVSSCLGLLVARIGPLEWTCTISNILSHIINAWHACLREPPVTIHDLGEVASAVRKLRQKHGRRLFVLLDSVDSSLEKTKLQTIVRLPMLTREPIGVLIISHLPWVQLYTEQSPVTPRPVALHMPAYTTPELLRILAQQRPPDISEHLYESFLRGCIKPACHASCQLRDVRTLSVVLLPSLRHAAQSSTVGEQQAAQIVQQVASQSKSLINSFREYYPGQSVDVQRSASSGGDDAQAASSSILSCHTSLAIPYLGKFLLLAAFLASSNRPSADHRAFSARAAPRAKKRRVNPQASDRQAEAAQKESVSMGQVCIFPSLPHMRCKISSACLPCRSHSAHAIHNCDLWS
jgi:hypothetical protein